MGTSGMCNLRVAGCRSAMVAYAQPCELLECHARPPRSRPPRRARARLGADHRARRARGLAGRRGRARGRGGRRRCASPATTASSAGASSRRSSPSAGSSSRWGDSRVEWTLDDRSPAAPASSSTERSLPRPVVGPRMAALSAQRLAVPGLCARRRRRRACSPRSPTRRAARSCARSSRRPSLTASRLAGELPITRQAVAKHLGALDRAGLVRGAPRGARDALHAHAGAARRGDRVDGRLGCGAAAGERPRS